MTSKPFVFMVMPFADTTANQVYENIVKPLCVELGYEVIRADEYTTTKVIYDEIVQSIQNAAIVVVDISGKNPNVMYELGVAHALRQKSTIILTHDSIAESPFDIKHFRIIGYENSIAGAESLKKKLRETIKSIKKPVLQNCSKSSDVSHEQDSSDEAERIKIEKMMNAFERLSDWQKSFLIQAIRENKQQWQRHEMPGGFDFVWKPEVDVLITKGIVKKVNYGVFLIDDNFFDTLQNVYFAEQ